MLTMNLRQRFHHLILPWQRRAHARQEARIRIMEDETYEALRRKG